MKKITFCGGGSAGHVTPNIALCEKLKDRYDLSYLGTEGIEKSICAANGIRFYTFDGVKLVRGKILCNLAIPFKLAKSVKQCKILLSRIQPDLLFCKGGYASLPPALAAAKLGIPVITHESDVTLGLANKIIARKSQKVLTTFPSTAEKLKNGLCTGSPMRENLFNRNKNLSRATFGFDKRPVILVFGGGSGSKIINECLRKNLFKLCENYNILHICGKNNVTKSNIDNYKQLEFADDMGAVYACADYAVARCGSNSAHELVALKIPTLFIPLDNGSSRGDQILNAEYFHSLGLCRVLQEKMLNVNSFIIGIDELVNDGEIKTALRSSNVGCGNDMIIKVLESYINR